MRVSSVVFLPHAPSSVSDVRKRLCSELRASGVYEEVADDAAVIISELISNALRHARPLPSGDIRVSWAYEGDLIQLAVSDGGSMTEPRRTRAALSSLGGRGLSIVEALSDGWGVSHESDSTTVWAELRAAQPSDNGHAVPLMQPLRIAFDQSA
ncbi:ATP-binding protein [Actinoallomurus sp. NPDC052308]|uniref:ATP-binding protein n=1 Tax=Actinoallomurus sp. NPDC052308 TaxID=3155530 RepID=UPI00343E6501